MEKIGVVVGSGPLGKEKNIILSLINNKAYAIAADGGIKFFVDENIVPDEWVGDMDSTPLEIESDYIDCAKIIRVSPIKDETDMELALNRLFDNGCDTAYVFGGIGGEREEHTFANVQLIHGFSKRGRKVLLISENKCFQIVTDGRLELGKQEAGFVSVFSLSDVAKNVVIEGLFYEYKGDLTNDYALGVSNEFCGKDAYVSVDKGSLLVISDNVE